MTIEFRNVSFHYDRNRPLINELSFTCGTGDFLLVVGQNGVGKSTLLKLLNGILKPIAGQVLVNGLDTADHPTSRLAKEICVTFQNPADQIFASTIRKEVEFAPRNLRLDNVDHLVDKALSLCALESLSSHHPYDLPTAQRKLLTIASAIASGASFLAFDEPSAGLSQIERTVFERLTTALKNDARGMIVVSHDLGLLLRYATKILVLARGQMIYCGDPNTILEREKILRQAGLRLPLPFRLGKILAAKRA